MTTNEAIRMAEGMLGMAEDMMLENEPWAKAPIDLLRALLKAEKQGGGMMPDSKADKHIEAADALEETEVMASIAYLEEAIRDMEAGEMSVLVEGERMAFVMEPVLHASLAALRKYAESQSWDENEEPKITIDGADELPAEVVAEIEKIAKGLAGERSAKVKVVKVEAKVEKTSEENSAE